MAAEAEGQDGRGWESGGGGEDDQERDVTRAAVVRFRAQSAARAGGSVTKESIGVCCEERWEGLALLCCGTRMHGLG